MKKLIVLYVLALIGFSCQNSDEENESDVSSIRDEPLLFDETSGYYLGTLNNGSTEVASWNMLLYENVIYGVSTNEEDEVLLVGVLDGVNVNGTATKTGVEDYELNFQGTIEGSILRGTWNDGEVQGIIAGTKQSQGPNGGYRGFTFDGGSDIIEANWVIFIHNEEIFGISTDMDDEIILSGIYDGERNSMIGTGVGQGTEGAFQLIWAATLENDIIEGTWGYGYESQGAFWGSRINGEQ